MKKQFFFVSLLLCFGASSAASSQEEGWSEVQPGVMQRTLENGNIETLGFGADGLRFKIEQFETHLAFLEGEHARHPSRELRRSIRAYRKEIRRTRAALNRVESSGELAFSPEALTAAGSQCQAHYDFSVEAFPLAQGAGARASAYFRSDCGQEGDVFAHASARTVKADNITAQLEKVDPSPNAVSIGSNVRAVASVGLGGVKDCYSFARATVTIYDPVVTRDVSATNHQCTGRADVRPFPVGSPTNLELSGPPPLDPNSAAIVANLNSENRHVAGHPYGVPFFDASVGTPRTIVCTEPWGTCPLSQQTIPIHPAWKADSAGTLVVIDYQNRKVYDFYRVSTNADGTVMINSNGTVTAGWGGVADLDGNGQSPGASSSDLSHLFGKVRVFEMERATTDPANAIRHALTFRSKFVCPAYRYPATKGSGTYTGTGCIPMGGRVFLDSAADCSTISLAGEKAICYALQKYGAYVRGFQSNTAFEIDFEAPTDGQPGGSVSNPYATVLGTSTNLASIPWSRLKVAADCRCSFSDLTPTSGRPFAEKAPTNLPLPAIPKIDAGSAAMVANLNSSWHSASLYEYGKPFYEASAGTPRTIVCTEPRGGTCGLSLQPVAVNGAWKPSSTSPSISVIDFANRKVYDFYNVALDADGTVKINADGTVSTAWGRVTDLDGNGQSPGSLLPDPFGTVRVFEMERAATDPANAIQHALAVTTRFACSTYRYPATKSDGTYTGTGCVPVGSRLYLDSTAACSTVSPAGEKALCYALQKYGAYVTGSGGSPFAVMFEAPTAGQPGGSAVDPYPGVGIAGDFYELSHIPWAKLRVAPDCQCTPY